MLFMLTEAVRFVITTEAVSAEENQIGVVATCHEFESTSIYL